MKYLRNIIIAAITGLVCSDFSAAAAEVPATAQSRKLIGTRWVVETISGAAVAGHTTPYIQFGADGLFSGSSGCNGIMGRYAVSGEAVSLRQVMTTRIGCSRNLKEQEQRFVAILNALRRLEIGPDGTLVLTTKAGASIRATAAPAQ